MGFPNARCARAVTFHTGAILPSMHQACSRVSLLREEHGTPHEASLLELPDDQHALSQLQNAKNTHTLAHSHHDHPCQHTYGRQRYSAVIVPLTTSTAPDESRRRGKIA